MSIEISERARILHEESLFIDIHNHMMFEYAINEALGKENVFDTYYAPLYKKGGINVVATTVGANSPCVCNLTDDLVHGCFEQIDMLRRGEERGQSFRICHNPREIRETAALGKTALLLAVEGARAFEGLESEESLVMLRTFYRLGVRTVCIVGGGRTRFGDGMGEDRAQAGLTTFGVKLIKEMNRLGILADLTHMTERSFWDSIEASEKPVLISHVGVKAVCPNPNNLSDDRIRAIGANGGVIGMEMVKTEIEWQYEKSDRPVTWDNVIRHIDHIVDLVGIDHVGIGLDFDHWEKIDNIHRAMCPAPGTIEGFYTGIPDKDHMLDDPNRLEECGVITEYLLRHGYSDEDVKKILGGNLMRLMEDTIW